MLAMVLVMLLAPGNPDEKVPYPMSGNGLLSWCEKYDAEKKMSTEAAMCAGYVQGVTDSISLFDYMLQLDKGAVEGGRPSCIPGGTTYEQHIRVIVKYLRDHPQQLHMQRLVLVVSAMRDAFPCPKEK